MRFCGSCGAPFSRACPACGFANPPGFRHCGACGAPLPSGGPGPAPSVHHTPRHLAERLRAEADALGARAHRDEERKIVTALFADIKGSMELLEPLDPEDARRIVDPALRLMMDAVHRYDGYVAQSMGDGIFALFGAPIAREDHAHRALYAALRMQEEGRRYAERLRRERGINLQIRVGINTGEVVLRSIRKDDLHTDYAPVGHSTGLAARMEALATPGSILVTEHTWRLTDGYFDFRDLGLAQVKGVSEPLRVFEVLGPGPLRTRLQVAAARRGLSRFVGRTRELAELSRAFELARQGRGQIVGVVGEAGVGKSRLFYEFKQAPLRGTMVLETFSISHGKAHAYLPLIELLHAYFQITLNDGERTRREKVTGRVLGLDRQLEGTLSYLFSLLGIPEAASALDQMDPTVRRQRTIDAIRRVLLRESLAQPLVLIVEDLHWLDGESDAFLQALSESLPTARMLLLVNHRPEYRHSWGAKTFYTQLRLDPFDSKEADELVAELLLGSSRLEAVKRFVLDRTQGNPFFIEELVRALFEEGVLVRDGDIRLARGLEQLRIPPTVQGVLAARIDRLRGEAKDLLQVMAVIGKEIPPAVLVRTVGHSEDELRPLLAELLDAEFIHDVPAFPEPYFAFTHALTQEVAYGSLLAERRRGLHEGAARAIEELHTERHAGRLEGHLDELAHHYVRSGNRTKAVEFLERAAAQAARRSAYGEALDFYTRALETLRELPESHARDHQELGLVVALGQVAASRAGFTAASVERLFARARELCGKVDDPPRRLLALRGIHFFHQFRAELGPAIELGDEMLALAERSADPVMLVTAHSVLAQDFLFLGELARALAHAEAGTAALRSIGNEALLQSEGPEALFGYAGRVSWLVGYPDQARAHARESIELARAMGRPRGLGAVFYSAAMLYQNLRDVAVTLALTREGLAVCETHGLVQRRAQIRAVHGWALAAEGHLAEGIGAIQTALTEYRATGAELARPNYLGMLAEAYMAMGRLEDGLAALTEAVIAAERTSQRAIQPELHRLRGELLLRSSAPSSAGSEAEACFQRALDLARGQGGRSFELRAAMSLARYWRNHERVSEARVLVPGIYAAFTEGFDTPDLRDAAALIRDLSGCATGDYQGP
jgi:class 3 adenylate cyclase/tetratricopeptide (TPR) repeat protein